MRVESSPATSPLMFRRCSSVALPANERIVSSNGGMTPYGACLIIQNGRRSPSSVRFFVIDLRLLAATSTLQRVANFTQQQDVFRRFGRLGRDRFFEPGFGRVDKLDHHKYRDRDQEKVHDRLQERAVI